MLHAWRTAGVAVVAWAGITTSVFAGPVTIPPDCGTRPKHAWTEERTETATGGAVATHHAHGVSTTPVGSPSQAGAAAPAMIPLPPAAWSGMLGLAALAGAGIFRKIRRLI